MQRSLRWIGIGLISTTLSSCGVLRSQLGLDSGQPVKTPPVVSDQPRTAPLQPGERGANKVAVTLPDGRSFTGKVLGGDKLTDVAVVKVVAEKLPVASLGDSNQLRPGE